MLAQAGRKAGRVWTQEAACSAPPRGPGCWLAVGTLLARCQGAQLPLRVLLLAASCRCCKAQWHPASAAWHQSRPNMRLPFLPFLAFFPLPSPARKKRPPRPFLFGSHLLTHGHPLHHGCLRLEGSKALRAAAAAGAAGAALHCGSRHLAGWLPSGHHPRDVRGARGGACERGTGQCRKGQSIGVQLGARGQAPSVWR